MHVNVTAPFALTQACLPLLTQADDSAVVFVLDDPELLQRAHWGGYGVVEGGAGAVRGDPARGNRQQRAAHACAAARADAHGAAAAGVLRRRHRCSGRCRMPRRRRRSICSARRARRRAARCWICGPTEHARRLASRRSHRDAEWSRDGNADDHVVGGHHAVPDHGSAGQYPVVPEPAEGRAAEAPAPRDGARTADRAGRAAGVPVRRPVHPASCCS